MSEFVSTRDIIGETALEDSIVSGSCQSTFTEYKDDLMTKVGRQAFASWSKLATVDLPGITGAISTQAFQEASVLSAVILRGGTMATLSATSAFSGTPIASGAGYIYVPAALIDSYKAATNWATYADQFRALEDYTVDGTVDGELDETKI